MYFPLDVTLNDIPNEPDDDDHEFAKGALVSWEVQIGGGHRLEDTNPKYQVRIWDDRDKLDTTNTVYPFERTPVYMISYDELGTVEACVEVYSHQTGERKTDCGTIEIVSDDHSS